MTQRFLKQCAKCPWKTSTDPHDIPNGYSVEKHRALSGTIAVPGSVDDLNGDLRIMACHETSQGHESPCAGWMHHQLGDGNNIALRIAIIEGRLPPPAVELDVEQHPTFEATCPTSTPT